MLKKIFTLVSAAVFSLLLLSGATNAVPFPVDNNFFMPFNEDVGVGNGGDAITTEYEFAASEFVNLQFLASVNHPVGGDPVPFGVLGLTMTWFVDNVLVFAHDITNASGAYNGPLTFFHALQTGEVGKMVLGGNFAANGGGYSLTVSAVPLPPAVIAFGTAMLGVGFLARRKRKKKEVFS